MLILRRVSAVEADRDCIDKTGKFREDISAMNKICLPIGINPDLMTALFEFCGILFDKI